MLSWRVLLSTRHYQQKILVFTYIFGRLDVPVLLLLGVEVVKNEDRFLYLANNKQKYDF